MAEVEGTARGSVRDSARATRLAAHLDENEANHAGGLPLAARVSRSDAALELGGCASEMWRVRC